MQRVSPPPLLLSIDCTECRQGCRASLGGLLPFNNKMLFKECLVFFACVELVRGQDCRENRHAGIHLDSHKVVDNGGRDIFMTINPAINYESRGYNGGIFSGLRQRIGLEKYFPGVGKFEVRHDVLARSNFCGCLII